jgi:hypothetical protein
MRSPSILRQAQDEVEFWFSGPRYNNILILSLSKDDRSDV